MTFFFFFPELVIKIWNSLISVLDLMVYDPIFGRDDANEIALV